MVSISLEEENGGETVFVREKDCILNRKVPKIYLSVLLKGQSSKNSDGPDGPDNRPFSFGGLNGKRTP